MADPLQDQEQIHSSILDALYCEEEQLEDEDDKNVDECCNFSVNINNFSSSSSSSSSSPSPSSLSLIPIMLLEQDLLWEDTELLSLVNKEKQGIILDDVSLIRARKEAVEWMLMVNSCNGFCTLTSILCVNYFDRFISSFPIQKDKLWTIHLTAVTCLSLAAKVEESYPPHPLDLQMDSSKPVFEPKVIQKMELLVLSTLDWKMHPVTPLSFLDHVIRRLGLKNHLHWEFLKRCEHVLLSLLSDWRIVSYVPSVLATAAMMHVIDEIEPCNSLEYHTQLLNVLNISKEKVNDCYELMVERSSGSSRNDTLNFKRKFEQMIDSRSTVVVPSSPSGVIDAYYFSSDSSNDSWTATNSSVPLATVAAMTESVSSSPVTSRKRARVHEYLPSLSRVLLVDVVDSPR